MDDPHWKQQLVATPADTLGFRLLITLHPDWTATEVLRLFRNRADLRCPGVINEGLPLKQHPESCVQPLRDVQLQHGAYDRAHFETKLSRNCEHLERHRLAHPHDHFQLWHLSRIQLTIGDLGRAAALLDELAQALSVPGLGLAPRRLASAHLRLAAPRYELALCRAAAQRFLRCPLFSLGAARVTPRLGNRPAALQWHQHTYRLWRSDRYDRTLTYRQAEIGPGALLAAGPMLAALGGWSLAGRVVREVIRQATALAGAAPCVEPLLALG